MTAAWVVAGIIGGIVVGDAGFWLGYFYGHGLGYRKAQKWQALADEYEHELAKADATIAQLNKNIGVVYDAGVIAGQTFQADRQEHDL